MTVENYQKHENVNTELGKAMKHLNKAARLIINCGEAHKQNRMELISLRIELSKLKQHYDFKNLD
ncbi:hypothetical protein [Flavobacteriaceae bacterium 14752]|uniref:hypothetical protein n=1 Tax=Mesohalobacter salilacus TaxID=2491711 RepID=UPI000F641C37|nr:hypothetical protein EIG84_05805 [Flavobacteriaceae bacterium 14752]